MNRELNSKFSMGPRMPGFVAVRLCVVSACLLTTGCLSPLAKHVKAFSDVSNVVITNSEDAYRAANELRDREQVTASIYAYQTNPTWSPYTDTKPLLTPEQLQARITVLSALKAYAASLTLLTGKPSDDLETNATAAGQSLENLNSTLATNLATSVPNLPVISSTQQNAISTAIVALGQYLISRKVKGSLPAITQQMNPNIETLCKALDNDIIILRRQADVDYKQLAIDQDSFIRHNMAALGPIQTRTEIGKLLAIVRQEKANDLLLSNLQTTLHTFEMTHQALAAAAQGNNPASLQQNIAQLAAAGKELKDYFDTLQAASAAAATTTSSTTSAVTSGTAGN